MYRYYRTHLAPQRSHAFNGLVYGGIGLKFLVSAARSAAARAWQGFDRTARAS
jgi:acyl-CoA hydrolase